YPQILTAFLILLLSWILVKNRTNLSDTQVSIFIGLVSGLTILLSPIILPVFFGMLVFLPFSSAPFFSFRNFRPSLIAILVSCCFVLPWIVRNWTVMGTTSISTIVGFNLLYGNSENAAPDLGTTASIDKYADAVRGMNEVETDRAFRSFAVDWVT